jgi:predicted RNase H-like HicB family nuclease
MKKYIVDVVIEKDKDGYYAYCPVIQGCYTQGETYEEALESIKDAIKLHLQDLAESGQKLPAIEAVSVATLEVAA